MKILFITNTARYNFAEPLGMMTMSGVLRDAGHETKFAPDIYGPAREILLKWKPEIVATTCTTGEHVEQMALNSRLKKARPFFSLMGGPHPTFFPDMVTDPDIDAVCKGEGEGAILDLVTAMENNQDYTKIDNLRIKDSNGEIHDNPLRPLIKNLDEVSNPDRETYYALHNRAKLHRVPHFIASRGCVFDCKYCFNKKYFETYEGLGARFRFRSPAHVVEECARVVTDFGGDHLLFVDDIFPVRPGWLEEFRQLYTKYVDVPWTAYTRIELIKPEMARQLAAAGCHSVVIGMESGNEELRREILGRDMTNESIVKKTDMLHDAGLKFQTTNIVGFPKETVESALETLDLNIKIKPSLASTFFFQPYPGTEAGEIAQRLGLYDGSVDGCGTTIAEVGNNYDIEDSDQLIRLRALMGPVTGMPVFKPLVPFLMKLPLLKLYNFISMIWVGWCSRFRLYPTKIRPINFVRATYMFVTGNGPY
ncbi:MAG: radical SAM protein [Candidatus Hydrogenedentota bacterium]